jgi:predicted PurR-regulated permease PerM
MPLMPSLSYRHLVACLLLALLAAVHLVAPKAAFELEMVLAVAAVLSPVVKRLSARLGGNRGAAVVLISLVVLLLVGLIAVFVLPATAQSLKDMLAALKDQIPALRIYLEEWIAELGAYASGIDLDNGLERLLEMLKTHGAGGAAFAWASKISLDVVIGVGRFLIACVILAILCASWDEWAAWSRQLLAKLAPAESPRILRIAERAQLNGIAMVRGLGIMALIFTSSYFLILAAIGMPFGKIIVLGLILGFFSALPAVGGFISAALALAIGLAHHGLYGWQSWVLFCAGVTAHFIEAKFLTPKVVGHAIDVPPFVMIGALLCGVSMNGPSGVFQALIMLPILRAMIDEIDMRRSAPAQAGTADDGPRAPVLMPTLTSLPAPAKASPSQTPPPPPARAASVLPSKKKGRRR